MFTSTLSVHTQVYEVFMLLVKKTFSWKNNVDRRSLKWFKA